MGGDEMDGEECLKTSSNNIFRIFHIWFSSDLAYCSCRCLFMFLQHLHPTPTLCLYSQQAWIHTDVQVYIWTTRHPETTGHADLVFFLNIVHHLRTLRSYHPHFTKCCAHIIIMLSAVKATPHMCHESQVTSFKERECLRWYPGDLCLM